MYYTNINVSLIDNVWHITQDHVVDSPVVKMEKDAWTLALALRRVACLFDIPARAKYVLISVSATDVALVRAEWTPV